jgi:chromate transporter
MDIVTFFLLLFYFNLITLGKGLLMIPLLQGALVDQAGILTTDQLLLAVAIGQVTPGPANIYVAAVGFMLYGALGAAVSLIAVALPSFSALALLRGYERLKANRVAQSFFKGLTTTAVGLIFYSALTLGQAAVTSAQAVVVFLFGFVLIQFLGIKPILGLFLAAGLGAILYLFT